MRWEVESAVQLRATVTREARVPANQVNIKPDGGTLTLAESNKGLQWTILGRGTHNRSTTAANYHSSVIFVMGRMAPRRIAAKPSCQIYCNAPAS